MNRRQMLRAVGSGAISGVLSSRYVRASAPVKVEQDLTWLIVDDPRPLKVAVAQLEKRYGWLVTYEDPPCYFAADLEDISKVAGTTVMVLKAQHLALASPLPPPSDNPAPETLIDAVIVADANRVGQSRFALRSSTLGFHVVPSAFRDTTGAWSVAGSILDSLIRMPPSEVSVMNYMEQFCVTLAQASGKRVTMATVPTRLLVSRSISQAADDQPASEVLIGALQSLNTPLTWRLLRSPEANRGYYLNIVPPG